MADFSFLSDSDDEKAVEELLSQAMDQSVLEQVAAINCSGFTHSDLPDHLEARFRKLKTFPATKPNPSNLAAASKSFNHSQLVEPQRKEDRAEENPDSAVDSPPPKLGTENHDFSASKKNPDRKMDSEPKSGSGSSSFSLGSPDFSTEPPSPPAKIGCIWCSPKKVSKKKGKENRATIGKGFDWGKSDAEFLSDLSTFSKKNQEKMLKKAMKEEEKINMEAEKIVQWAKQASARIDFAGLDDELSDNEAHGR
ncbi:PREDICTED: uncharacterized protein LOC109169767 [Ipomoea nil]|uniref:uncharacterized protein LOC109169767 n=1 Tax=Ipomoea nil TaxID=35883 RepID=UPI000901E0B2|nr:PREDICTED: uncharacterized protein LOC109169767 [Ipomoea nil]